MIKVYPFDDESDIVLIWVVQRALRIVALQEVSREELPSYRLVLIQQDGHWRRAYERSGM
jgi:hypothetical protein